MRVLLAFALWARAAGADASVGEGGELLLREVSAAARFGEDFDPRRVDPHHLGQYVHLYNHGAWSLFMGEDNAYCCEEPDTVKPPRWERGVLRLREQNGHGFYACPDGAREIVIRERDGAFDVDLCGKRYRMVRSLEWYQRYRQWSRATANRMMGGDYGCRTVAVQCDEKRLAVACDLPLGYALLLERGRRPVMVSPNPGVMTMAELNTFDERVECLATWSESP